MSGNWWQLIRAVKIVIQKCLIMAKRCKIIMIIMIMKNDYNDGDDSSNDEDGSDLFNFKLLKLRIFR